MTPTETNPARAAEPAGPVSGELDTDARRYLELQAAREQIEHEQSEIKARMRSALSEGRHDTPSGARVTITRNRRFDSAKAAEVIPAELLPLVQTTVIDAKRAKEVLAPRLLDQCRVEYGEPRVAIA